MILDSSMLDLSIIVDFICFLNCTEKDFFYTRVSECGLIVIGTKQE